MASKKYLVNINLDQNFLEKARFESLASAPSSPVDGQIYHNSGDGVVYKYHTTGTTWKPLVITDLSEVVNQTDKDIIEIQSSTGNKVRLNLATVTRAGLMSKGDKDKLDKLVENVQDAIWSSLNDSTWSAGEKHDGITITYDDTANKFKFVVDATNLGISDHGIDSLKITSSTGTDITLPSATTEKAGLLSKADKVKLNGIETGATADQNADEVPYDNTSYEGSGSDLSATNVEAAINEILSLHRDHVAVAAGGLDLQGELDASGGTFPAAGTIKKGHLWVISNAGELDGTDTNNPFKLQVEPGDILIALVDNASSATATHWTVIEKNLVQATKEQGGTIKLANYDPNDNTFDGATNNTAVTPDILTDYIDSVAGGYVSPSNVSFAQGGSDGDVTETITHNLGSNFIQLQAYLDDGAGNYTPVEVYHEPGADINKVDVTIFVEASTTRELKFRITR